MTPRHTAALTGGAVLLVVLAGSLLAGPAQLPSSPGDPPPAPPCGQVGGGRCTGPAPIGRGVLSVTSDGRTVMGAFGCGGSLTATDDAAQVRVTYTASAVPAGGLSCTSVVLTVTLPAPLGSRTLVDGVTGADLMQIPTAVVR